MTRDWHNQIKGTAPLRQQNEKQPKLQVGINTREDTGQPKEQLFPKRWTLNYPNLNKYNLNTNKVKQYRNWHLKKEQREPYQKYCPWLGQ